jgi:hypothetical protein
MLWISFAVAGVLLLIGTPLLIVWLVVRSGRELARASVKPGEPIVLTGELEGESTVTLWCDVAVDFQERLSLEGPLRIEVAGGEAWSGTFSLGPRGSTQKGSASRIKRSWLLLGRSARGVTRIAKLTAGPGAISVTGTISAGPGTSVEKLELFLGAR